jgi:hypothetical protein
MFTTNLRLVMNIVKMAIMNRFPISLIFHLTESLLRTEPP